jgi:hypothetical protein
MGIRIRLGRNAREGNDHSVIYLDITSTLSTTTGLGSMGNIDSRDGEQIRCTSHIRMEYKSCDG